MSAVSELRSISREVEAQAEAAADLLSHLGQLDEDTAHDTIEGETDLMEAIDRALAALDEAEAMAVACDDRSKLYSERKRRFDDNAKFIRGLIEQAMVRADLATARRPGATLTVKKRDPAPIVTDEAAIPARFWKQPAPVLDKKALNDAAKAGEEIPGMSRDNGGFSLQIRRK